MISLPNSFCCYILSSFFPFSVSEKKTKEEKNKTRREENNSRFIFL